MDEPDSPARKIRLADLGFDDLVLVAAAMALGAGAFMLVFHLVAWLSGWPGPFLWFGTESRISDILTVSGAVMVFSFIFNIFGAACFLALAALVRLLSR